MPLYIYHCGECNNEFEERGGTDDAMRLCPLCGRDARRLPCSGLPYLRGETVSNGLTNASKAGDIKNKHGQYRTKLWNENAGEVKRAREKSGEEGYAREREEKRSGPNPFDMALERAATENQP